MPAKRAMSVMWSIVLAAAAAAQDRPAEMTPKPVIYPEGTPGPSPAPNTVPDLAKEPTLYVVGYAHLDTQWRWCYPQTIREFIPATLDNNAALFEKYPGYVFNFTGSRRYQMMEEYYPDRIAQLKKEVEKGQWFPCGSSVDENDANVPSAESLIRQVLYGNRYFRKTFGIASDEYMLPDCFGFPAALPSVLAHCGIIGFSTQKLTWNAVVPIPFKVGVWQGPDNHSVTAALDPGSYGGEVMENLATSEGWKKRIDANGAKSGVFTDYHYYGTGDQGGSPTERSVEMVQKSIDTKGPIRVISGPADWMFKAITPAMREKLPTYKGELLLTEHSAGSVTSEAYMKRWNRKNELLADAAERASVMAWWLSARDYPAARLEQAWSLVLGSQMHDILPGTSHPRAYDYAWNDEVVAGNLFSNVLLDGADAVIAGMDTTAKGVPIVVFNPLSTERDDVVEAVIPGPVEIDGKPGVTVVDSDGKAVPSEILDNDSGIWKIAFRAHVLPLSFTRFDARLNLPAPQQETTGLRADEHHLESARYLVTIDDHGDVSSIRDKQANRELLSAPIRLGQHYENPRNWPAWNQDWTDRQLPTKEYADGPAKITIVERGPARVALEVTRTLDSSTFTQRISLAAGGDRVEFDNTIDWTARERSLRVEFPLTVNNPIATYDIQSGVIERPNNAPKRYEAPVHQWMDLTDSKGDYGVAILNDCKYGSDKPDDHTLRLTLLHTPGTQGGYEDQGTQDIGRHHVKFALVGHAGDWKASDVPAQASRLNQPLIPFKAAPHPGPLGPSFSLLHLDDAGVRICALKKAEETNEVIVRVRELAGKSHDGVHLAAAAPILEIREVDGQERAIPPAADWPARVLTDGAAAFSIKPYELRAFAIKLGAPPFDGSILRPISTKVALGFDADVVSTNAARTDGAMDATEHRAYPAEQFPKTMRLDSISFGFGPTGMARTNALVCRGQKMMLPVGHFDELVLIAASSGGDVTANLTIGDKQVPVGFQSWSGFIGQWDHRLWLGEVPELTFGWSNELGGIEPGYIKPAPVAWYASHQHTPTGDAQYQYCYLFEHAIDLPPGARSVVLPDDPRIKIFAATAVRRGAISGTPEARTGRVSAAAPLFDALDDRHQDAPRIEPASGSFSDAATVHIVPRLYWKAGAIHYTLDGADPTPASPVYGSGLILNHSATIKTGIVDGAGKMGPITSAHLEVNDRTPPKVVSVTPIYASPTLRIRFSEPVDAATVAASGHLSLDPAIAVQSVTLSADQTEATLALASPLAVGTPYKLAAKSITDTSPAHNELAPASVDVQVRGPVYSLATIGKEQMGAAIPEVPGLPVKAGDSWTLNCFVKAAAQPDNRTLIVGFGKAQDKADGQARYFAKFAGGLRLWSRNRDVEGDAQLDLNAWQMLTATYDGKVLTLYKNGKAIGHERVKLADDENVVNIAPIDPWEKKRSFVGELQGLTIWNQALTPEAIESLMHTTAPKN